MKEQRHIINIEDVERNFKTKSTPELMKNVFLFNAIRLTNLAPHAIPLFFEGGGSLAVSLARWTSLCNLFCGGEDLQQVRSVTERLSTKEGIQCILNYAVEGTPTKFQSQQNMLISEEKYDHVCKALCEMMEFNANQNREHELFLGSLCSSHKDIIPRNSESNAASDLRCSFGVVKITSLADFAVLERLSQILCCIQQRKLPPTQARMLIPPFLYIDDQYEPKRTAAFPNCPPESIEPLNQNEIKHLQHVMDRLMKLCDVSKEAQLPLLIDAEQTFVQPAIDQIFMKLCLKYNKHSVNGTIDQRPLIYNTYQLYLKDGFDRMKYDFDFLKSQNCRFGLKTVRGAYIKTEHQRSQNLGLINPVNDSIERTHVQYNNAVKFCLENIRELSILIATHNEESLVKATDLFVNEYGLDQRDRRIQFGFVYGMANSLSASLVNAGFLVNRYIPYGPISTVMPYLSRRVIENSDVLGGAQKDIKRCQRELKRRIIGKYLPSFRDRTPVNSI